MKFNIFLSLLGVLIAGFASARSLSPSEALSRVETFPFRKVNSKSTGPTLLTTVHDKTGQPTLYVFSYSDNNGFLLVTADDAVPPLLGYSATNSFSMHGMPENLASWISSYTDQIENARSLEPYVATETRAGDMAEIKPMLTTNWDQGVPFNNLCPKADSGRSVTGCIATAMAQVMNYWEYPAIGKGSVKYTPGTLSQELSMDFSSTAFDWDNMRDSYKKNYSGTEAQAVATLMKACGYSVKMMYNSTSSGAFSKDIAPAFINYFGYDKGVTMRDRADYDSQEAWNEMVYKELSTTGPVIYNGQSSSGAHCFVCDGYDGNGFFHINWGWGGVSDGYFLLNELTPAEIGTGGHYGGYNLNQSVIVGIMPPVGRLTVEGISIDNAADDSGNVKGWGYTYRINDFSNILLAVNLTIAGGHISAPLYYTVYEYDPDAKKNKDIVLESQFDEPLNSSDGKVTCSTYVSLRNYDPGKLYNLAVAYDLKGQRTTIGSVRLAASAGVDDVTQQSSIDIRREGNTLVAECESTVSLSVYDLGGVALASTAGPRAVLDLSGLQSGVYIAVANASDGRSRRLKLHLK